MKGEILESKLLSKMISAKFMTTIPTGQWSGSGSDYYITVSASNVTVNSILKPFWDRASGSLLRGPVWCVPAAGSFTIHTSAIPAGTVTIIVELAGVVGEAQYQVLSNVYSKDQVDAIVSQSTANKAKYFDSGVCSGSSNTESIGKAWDAITEYDKTVVGQLNHNGMWMYIAYKYSGSRYGMMLAISYNTYETYRLNVIDGQKEYYAINTTKVT